MAKKNTQKYTFSYFFSASNVPMGVCASSQTLTIPPSLPPALVTSLDSIGEYTVEGAIPIIDGVPNPSHKQSPWSERFIHASLLARFPSIHAVVHSHSPAAVAFSVSPDTPLRPVWHMAGFLEADGVKVWDIADAYHSGGNQGAEEEQQSGSAEKHNLLVNNQRLGDSLAAAFSAPSARGDGVREEEHRLRRQVVLQRGHGFAAVGTSLRQVVYRAIYTQENAKIQRDALAAGAGSVRYLTEEETRDCVEMGDASVEKAWPLWVKEVSEGVLFQNQLAEKKK